MVTPRPAPCNVKEFQSTYLCGRAKIMIIPLKVKIPVSLKNTSEMSVEKNATCKQFPCLETATLHKTEWTKFSENKENQTIGYLFPSRAAYRVSWLGCQYLPVMEVASMQEHVTNCHLPPTEHSWRVANNFTALFSRALTSVLVASVPCQLNRTWDGYHTIHREVLSLSWLPGLAS